MTGHVDLDKLQMRPRLRWFDHVHRRENDHAVKSTDHISDLGTRPAGRLKKRWIDRFKR